MPTVNVTLEDILRARDGRANAQRRLLHSHRLPLVSFTMNIAGPVKSAPLIELAFDAGLEALYAALGQPEAAEVIRPTISWTEPEGVGGLIFRTTAPPLSRQSCRMARAVV